MLPQDHTVMVRQTSRWGQIFLLSLVGVGITAITTAWVYRIDEVVTVSGRLIPQKGGVEVKSPLAEQLSKVYVKTGEKVNVPKKKTIKWKMSKDLFKKLNNEKE